MMPFALAVAMLFAGATNVYACGGPSIPGPDELLALLVAGLAVPLALLMVPRLVLRAEHHVPKSARGVRGRCAAAGAVLLWPLTTGGGSVWTVALYAAAALAFLWLAVPLATVNYRARALMAAAALAWGLAISGLLPVGPYALWVLTGVSFLVAGALPWPELGRAR